MKEKTFNETEKQIDKLENRYKYSIIASKRARLLNEGAEKKIETTAKKNTTIALNEVSQNKLKFK